MTALQEFYKEIESLEGIAARNLISTKDIKQMIGNYYLEKEKQQIATAFDIADNINAGSYINGTDYYEQTYESN